MKVPITIAAALLAFGCSSRQNVCCTAEPKGGGPLQPVAVVDSLEPIKAAANADKPMKIELLGFPSCPDTPALRDNLRAALEGAKEGVAEGRTFVEINQASLPESDLRRGWPTPTILVNGRDLFGMEAPANASMGCRVYPDGVPDAARISKRLNALAGR